jgi:hypothetical protein
VLELADIYMTLCIQLLDGQYLLALMKITDSRGRSLYYIDYLPHGAGRWRHKVRHLSRAISAMTDAKIYEGEEKIVISMDVGTTNSRSIRLTLNIPLTL